MIESFEWKDSYSVNNELMDRQHRRMLDLATRVLQAGKDSELLQLHLDSLCSHTQEHFRAEERLMRECGFPGYVEHRATHDRIMDQFHSLNALLRVNPRATSRLEVLMVEWVLEQTPPTRQVGDTCDIAVRKYVVGGHEWD